MDQIERNSQLAFSILEFDEEGKLKITSTQLLKLFGRNNGKVAFQTTDLIYIDSSHSKFVKNKSETTIGKFINNKLIIEPLEVFGYVNDKPFNKPNITKFYNEAGRALRKGDLTSYQLIESINNGLWLYGGTLAYVINPSIPIELLTCPPEVKKRKAELLELHKKELEAGDVAVCVKIEKELCAMADKIIRSKGQDAIDILDSKSGIDINNVYKVNFIMKGAIPDLLNPGKYKIVTSSLDEGIKIEELANMASSAVGNLFSVSNATADGGYLAKKYNAIYGLCKALEKGSDCGTKKTASILITKGNGMDYEDRYIVERNKLVKLTVDNLPSYYDKKVNMRIPMGCMADKGNSNEHYCNICMGDKIYEVGRHDQFGREISDLGNKIVNLDLKQKHDSNIKLGEVKIEDIMRHA
jgi:hypothetical protein